MFPRGREYVYISHDIESGGKLLYAKQSADLNFQETSLRINQNVITYVKR